MYLKNNYEFGNKGWLKFLKDDPYYSDWRRMDNFSAEDLVDESSSRDIKTIEKKMIVGLSSE